MAARKPGVFCECTLWPHSGTSTSCPLGKASRNRSAASGSRIFDVSPRMISTVLPCAPDQALMIGDDVTADCEGALRAGLRPGADPA